MARRTGSKMKDQQDTRSPMDESPPDMSEQGAANELEDGSDSAPTMTDLGDEDIAEDEDGVEEGDAIIIEDGTVIIEGGTVFIEGGTITITGPMIDDELDDTGEEIDIEEPMDEEAMHDAGAPSQPRKSRSRRYR